MVEIYNTIIQMSIDLGGGMAYSHIFVILDTGTKVIIYHVKSV